jgi:hypothetical protein
MTGMGVTALYFALLSGSEQLGFDNCKMWHVSNLPLTPRVGARQSFSRVRIFHHPDLVPNEASHIKFVLQDAGSPLKVAVDR